jgi:hypothetical protein
MRKVLVAVLGACVLAFCMSAQAVHAESIQLCPTGEVTPQCGEYPSIKAAVEAASPNWFIIVASGVYTAPGTLVNKDLTILGAGSDSTIVQAADTLCGTNDRVFTVDGARVTIQDLTVRNGCIYSPTLPAGGAGIWNSGALTLKHVYLHDNLVIYGEAIPLPAPVPVTWIPMGGAIYNVGALVVDSSTIMSNAVASTAFAAMGGGIYNNGYSAIVNSTISANRAIGAALPAATFYGGGIYNAGSLKVEFTTVITNDAATAGGGIYSVGAIHLGNNLFSGNRPSEVLCPVITSVKAATNDVASAGVRAVTDMVSDTQCNPPLPTPICFEAVPGVKPVPYFIPCDKSASINAANCQDSRVKVDLRGSTRKQNKCDLGSIERGVSLLATVAFTESLVPDLVVRSVTIEPKGELTTNTKATIKVVVENVGNYPTPHRFFVNLYINPRETPPNRAGVIWIDLCHTSDCINDQGMIWSGPPTLGKGQMVTLSSELEANSSIVTESSQFGGFFREGQVDMWVYVDAWNKDRSPNGIILEGNEENNMWRVPTFSVKKGRIPTVTASNEQLHVAPVAPLEP